VELINDATMGSTPVLPLKNLINLEKIIAGVLQALIAINKDL